MQAHQFVTALSYGDAIGDYTLEIQRILGSNGYESEIYSEIVHPRMAKNVRPLFDYEFHQSDEVLMIVHFSIGSALGLFIPYTRGKKLMIYHNITPHQWFVDINTLLAYQCLIGRNQLKKLRDYFPMSLADSEYNRQELESLGFPRTGVLPIRLNFDKFNGKPDPLTCQLYDDHRTNIIVVGRAIPNKKLEDSLKAFAYYQKYINPLSRLIFVGLWNGFESYLFALRNMVTDLGAQEVVFTGHIQFEEILAYFKVADALLIMSEHEGFCVPLLEAYYLNVPVVAWDACAIHYTAGKGAILAQGEKKDYAAIGEILAKITSDSVLRKQILNAQRKQLQEQAYFPFEETLLKSLEELKTMPSLYKEEIESAQGAMNGAPTS
jgi:glycosyltransferase involved in cell wall biosynthesis